jgi:hypothetical protein
MLFIPPVETRFTGVPAPSFVSVDTIRILRQPKASEKRLDV